MEKKPARNVVCQSCLKWDRFGDGCRVFWEDKKICTMRVTTPEEWDFETQILRR
ncbi:MAG: hypothetical protein ABIJ21_01185 [Nanoarchaeota archaeon]